MTYLNIFELMILGVFYQCKELYYIRSICVSDKTWCSLAKRTCDLQ